MTRDTTKEEGVAFATNPLTNKQVAEIHWLSESMGRECPRMGGWSVGQAKEEIKTLRERVRYLESQYGE